MREASVIGWLRALFSCSHAHCYLERRARDGVAVLHLVCDRCGRAVPAIDRTADDAR